MSRTNYHYIISPYGVGTAQVWFVDERRKARVVAAGDLFTDIAMHGVPHRVVGRVLATGSTCNEKE